MTFKTLIFLPIKQ